MLNVYQRIRKPKRNITKSDIVIFKYLTEPENPLSRWYLLLI